jgi:2-keto-4-pentenoate hydratase
VTAHSTQLTDAAQLVYDTQSSGIPIAPLTQTYPDLDVPQAYSVQRLNLAHRIDQGGVAKITQICEGTNQIRRVVMARALLA